MKDRDQQLLWEAYLAQEKKGGGVASRTPPKDKLNKGDFLPKHVRDEINDEDDTPTNDKSSGEKDDEEEIGSQGVEETNSGDIRTALNDDEDPDHYEKTGEIRKKKDEDDEEDGVEEDDQSYFRNEPGQFEPEEDLSNHPAMQRRPKPWEDARFEDMALQLINHQQHVPEEVMYNLKAAVADALEDIGVDYVQSTSSDDIGGSR